MAEVVTLDFLLDGGEQSGFVHGPLGREETGRESETLT
jgi:hypothetical protein